MNDSDAPKLERRFRLRTPLVFALLVLSGCGPSKEDGAIDAYNRGVDHYEQGELGHIGRVFSEENQRKVHGLVGLYAF